MINSEEQKPWVVKPNISLSIDLEESYDDEEFTNPTILLVEYGPETRPKMPVSAE